MPVIRKLDTAGMRSRKREDKTAGFVFPRGTRISEMTADQQAAYWKSQARKWEHRAKTVQKELKQVRQVIAQAVAADDKGA